jgi:prepilin-type N-terminal cleavage/methylation domain-containing protein
MNKIRQSQKQKNGFTLLESLFAAMLIGLVIAALAASSGAFTMANAAGVDLSTAEFLIEEIRERTAAMPFADIAAFTRKPPIDVDGSVMNEFAAFEQQVAVENCGADFNAPAADFVRVTVTIRKNGQEISKASWIRAKLD